VRRWEDWEIEEDRGEDKEAKKAIIRSKRRQRIDIAEIHTFVDCKKYLNKVNGKKKNGK